MSSFPQGLSRWTGGVRKQLRSDPAPQPASCGLASREPARAHSAAPGGGRLCARHLLTSRGLRSLAPDHPNYTGHCGGDQRQHDEAYHQGTVWGWLLGPFVPAHFRVYGDAAHARSFLEPMADHLSAHGLGSLSEIFDGDPPFRPDGCIAQAWTVAEVLRAWMATVAPDRSRTGRRSGTTRRSR